MIRNNEAAFAAAVELAMAEARRQAFDAEPHHFDDMDDLVAYSANRDGFVAARRVA